VLVVVVADADLKTAVVDCGFEVEVLTVSAE
jgi:hypothetical protein